MTLNSKIVVISEFLQFQAAAHIFRVNFLLIAKVAGPMLSRVTWALLKLLVFLKHNTDCIWFFFAFQI